mgnify:CR=1 FL=1
MGLVRQRWARRGGPRRWAGLSALAGVLLVVGCTGGSGAVTSTTSTSSVATSTPTSAPSSTTTTPPPGPTDVPSAARQHNAAGAKEFAKYFVSAFNRSWTDADPSVLDGLCEATSKACAAYREIAYTNRG